MARPDIFHTGLVGIFTAVGKTSPEDKAQGRALVRGLAAKAADLPEPGSAMSSNSRVPYISYLSRGLALEADHVAVLTGRLPSHPRTLDGNPTMEAETQVRYFSITAYPEPDWFNPESFGIPHASVMDEQIVTDDDGWYCIVYSRPGERPANATAGRGATWQNWGNVSTCGWTIRWLTVDGGWRDAAIVPGFLEHPLRRGRLVRSRLRAQPRSASTTTAGCWASTSRWCTTSRGPTSRSLTRASWPGQPSPGGRAEAESGRRGRGAGRSRPVRLATRCPATASPCRSAPTASTTTAPHTATCGRKCSTRCGGTAGATTRCSSARTGCWWASWSPTTSTPSLRGMQDEPVNARWQAEMADLFEPLETGAADTSLTRLERVFHLA